MSRRTTSRVLSVVLVAVLGAVWLSGSDEPVTAHPYPHWQELTAPPLSPRIHAAGIRVGDDVLISAAEGNGPVNALDAALRLALNGALPAQAPKAAISGWAPAKVFMASGSLLAEASSRS